MVALALIAPAQPGYAASSTQQARSTRPAAPSLTTSKSSTAKAKKAPVAKAPAKKAYSASASRARQARVAQARLTARARDTREVQTPRFKIDDTGEEVPDVRAAAAIIYNPDTQQVLWQSNATEER
jgi:hypothetical protein